MAEVEGGAAEGISHYPDLYSDDGKINYVALALAQLSYIPNSVERTIRQSNRWEDYRQEMYVVALEAYQAGEDVRQTRARAQRAVRATLRQDGFVRKTFPNGKRRLTQAEFLASGFFNKDGSEDNALMRLEQLMIDMEINGRVPDDIEKFYLEQQPIEFEIPTVLADLLFSFAAEVERKPESVMAEALLALFKKNADVLVEATG